MSEPTPSKSPGTDVAAPCGTAPEACGGAGGCGGATAATGAESAPAADSTACCGGGGAAEATPLQQERRAVVITGLVGVAVALAGLVIGGWVGFALVALVAAGIAAALARSWPRLSRNDRLIRLAVVVLLVGLALVRAMPR